jgi:hypothetical protein
MAKQKIYIRSMKQKFQNSVELLEQANKLDVAEPRTIQLIKPNNSVFGQPYEPEMIDMQNYAVFNLNTEKVASYVSKGYKIFQHKDFVTTTISILNSLGISCKGEIFNLHNRCNINIYLDKEIDINGDKITMGFRLINSYDKSTGIVCQNFGLRQVCNNGMVLSKFGESSISLNHNTTKNIEQMIMKLIDKTAKQYKEFNQLISESMLDSVEWQTALNILEVMHFSKKKIKELSDIMMREYGERNLTRWEIYNSLTNLATHGERITPNLYEYLQNKAQKILITPTPKLLLINEVI